MESIGSIGAIGAPRDIFNTPKTQKMPSKIIYSKSQIKLQHKIIELCSDTKVDDPGILSYCMNRFLTQRRNDIQDSEQFFLNLSCKYIKVDRLLD